MHDLECYCDTRIMGALVRESCMPLPARLRLAMNLGSSYAHILVMALVTLWAIPVYAARLGPEEWGVVALCLTLQGALHALDIALAPLMLRDLARAGKTRQALHSFRYYRRLYGRLAAGLALAGCAVLLVVHPSGLFWPLTLALLQFALQFANHAAIGYWHGLQQQVEANLRLALFQALKHGGAVAMVFWVDASAVAFLCPFVLIGAVEWAVNQRRVLGSAAQTDSIDIPLSPEGDLRRYSFVAAIGILTTQVDRIGLSLLLPLPQYGEYYLICSLMLSALSLQPPVQRAYLPRIATSGRPRADALAMLKVSIVFLVVPYLATGWFAEDLLRLWLDASNIAPDSIQLLRLLMVAAALSAIYGPTAAIWLSEHRYHRLLKIHMSVLLLQCVALYCLAPSHPTLTGAAVWLCLGVIQASAAAWFWLADRR